MAFRSILVSHDKEMPPILPDADRVLAFKFARLISAGFPDSATRFPQSPECHIRRAIARRMKYARMGSITPSPPAGTNRARYPLFTKLANTVRRLGTTIGIARLQYRTPSQGACPLPTHLPPPRRAEPKKKPSIIGVALNTFMVVSALVLAFIVVRQEQRATMGWPQGQTVAATQQTEPAYRANDAAAHTLALP